MLLMGAAEVVEGHNVTLHCGCPNPGFLLDFQACPISPLSASTVQDCLCCYLLWIALLGLHHQDQETLNQVHWSLQSPWGTYCSPWADCYCHLWRWLLEGKHWAWVGEAGIVGDASPLEDSHFWHWSDSVQDNCTVSHMQWDGGVVAQKPYDRGK